MIYNMTIFLKVYDGRNANASMLATFEGTYAPNVVSTGPYLYMRFTTDGSIIKAGFRLRFRGE